MNKISLVVLSAFYLATAGCDDLSNGQIQNQPVEEMINERLLSDQTLAYPYIEQQHNNDHQPIELQRFSDAIVAMHDGGEDQLLRRMVERVPIRFILENLSQLQFNETTSVRGRENISKLLARIRHFRELDERTAPALIFQACHREEVDTLCVCIFALGTESLQAFAADALRTLADPKSARCLLIALYKSYGAAGGGSESIANHQRLRLSLAKAFGDVTDIDVSDYDGSGEDFADMKKILRQGDVWLEEHEEEL
ncbi:MAG: hypothetical protein ACKVT0_16160 [Planctomycetaceae bacterium]